ncbi:neuronal acetylcholine receptor subunit alpha-9-like [Saccoglossus kowalevskii]
MKTKDVSASISEDDGIWLRQSKLDPGTQAMINELKSVSSSLKFLVTRKINEEHEENVNREWKQVAIVMNRFFMYVFSFVCVEKTSMEYKKALKDKLFGGSFDPSFRPVINESDPVVVKLRYTPTQIVALDEIRQILTTVATVHMTWHDDYLNWNSSEYGGLQVLRLSSSTVWTPPIKLRNSADKEHFMVDTLLTIFNDGSVLWYASVTLNTFCSLDLFFFPVDEQMCTQEFGMRIPAGLLGMDYLDLKLMNDEYSVPDYQNINQLSRDWGLRNMHIYVNEKFEFFGPVYFIVAELHLYRVSFFYLMNLVIPCTLIFLLTLFGFCLPPDSGEKVGLSVTIILICNAMAFMTPSAAAGVSMLALVNILTMILVAVFTGMNVIVLTYWYRGPECRPIPQWMRTVVLKYLARLLCMKNEVLQVTKKRESERRHSQIFKTNVSLRTLNDEGCSRLLDNECFELKNGTNRKVRSTRDFSSVLQNTASTSQGSMDGTCVQILDDISSNLNYLVVKSMEEQKEDKVRKEWRKFAMILNRFFLLAFVGLVLLEIMYLFLQIDASSKNNF